MGPRGAHICWFDCITIHYDVDSTDFVFNYKEKVSAGMVKGYWFAETVVMEPYAYIWCFREVGLRTCPAILSWGGCTGARATDDSRPVVKQEPIHTQIYTFDARRPRLGDCNTVSS